MSPYDPRLGYSNAALTAVTPAAAGDSYRSAPAAPAARWTGSVRVHVEQGQKVKVAKDDTSNVEPTKITLELTATALTGLVRGDTLTFTIDGGAAQSRRVREIDTHDLVGLAIVTCWEE